MNELRSTKQVLSCKTCTYKTENLSLRLCPSCSSRDNFEVKEMYNSELLFSYNAFMNAVIGVRRRGKTHMAIDYCKQQYLSKGRHFVILRRYLTQLTKIKNSLTKFGFEVKNNDILFVKKEAKLAKDRIVEKVGEFMSISTYNNIKGADYLKTFTIVIDEYADELQRGDYLDELIALDSIIVTVLDEKQDSKVIALSNNVCKFLPLYRRMRIRWNQEWSYNPEANSVAHIFTIENNEFSGSANAWLKTGDYYNYAVQNDFLNDEVDFIEFEKLEFAETLFCFQLDKNRSTLRLVEYELQKYAIDYCFNCKHSKKAVDLYNAVVLKTNICISSVNKLRSVYFDSDLKFADLAIKTAFQDYIFKLLYREQKTD